MEEGQGYSIMRQKEKTKKDNIGRIRVKEVEGELLKKEE